MSRPIGDVAKLIFTSKEVCQVTGITARQLQWWDEHALVRAGRQGHRRAFHPEDVLAMLVVGELRRKGLSLQKIRRLMRRLRQEVARRRDELYESGSECYLLTDGEALYSEAGPQAVVKRLTRERSPMWLVSLSERMRRLEAFRKGGDRLPRSRHKRQPENQLSLFAS